MTNIQTLSFSQKNLKISTQDKTFYKVLAFQNSYVYLNW